MSLQEIIEHWKRMPSPYDEGLFYKWECKMDELIQSSNQVIK